MSDIALLAPVPLVHLLDGHEVCASKGKVAFGSRAWEVFRELDEIRSGQTVPALIYASMANMDGPVVVSWIGEYIGHVESRNGTHPSGMEFRPPSTAENKSDNLGWWAIFWEVANLQELPEEQQLSVQDIQSRKGDFYKSSFIPEGPIIVQNPWHQIG